MRHQEKPREPPAEQCNPVLPTRKRKPASFYLSFLSLLLMVFIVSLDSTTLAVALPILARELRGTTLEAFWANISFMLAVVIFQPFYVTTSDVLGRKIPLYTALFLFFVGSLVFALAPNMAVVIFARTLQGLGGSGLDVLNEIITADMTTLKERPLYLGILAIPMAVGCILGPPVGALLSQFISWRWLGWINLPLTTIGFLLVFFFLRLRPLEGSFFIKFKRLDLVGLILFTIGCSAFVLPLSWAGSMYAWKSWKTLLPLILGVLILALFAVYERMPTNPVIPYRLFGPITTITSLFGAFIHGLIVYSINIYLPLFLQAVLLETTTQSAITMLPANIIALLCSGFSPLIVSYLRKYLWNIWLGWMFLAVGTGLLCLIGQESSVAFATGVPVVAGVGLGILFTILIIPVQASVLSVDDVGLAVGLLLFFRLLGGLIGLALGSTMFSSIFVKSMATLGALPKNLAVLGSGSDAISFIPDLREHEPDISLKILNHILKAYSDSFHAIWLLLAGMACLGFFASFFTKEVSMESEELGRQRFEPS